MMTKSAVMFIKLGKMPNKRVIFIIVLRLLKRKRDIVYAVRMTRIVEKMQLKIAT